MISNKSPFPFLSVAAGSGCGGMWGSAMLPFVCRWEPPLACFKANSFFSSGTIYYGHKLLCCHLLLLLIFFLRGDRRDLGLARAAGMRRRATRPTGGGGFCKPADLGSGILGLGTLGDASVGGDNVGRGCRFCPLPPLPGAA